MSAHPKTDAAGNEFTPSATFSTEDGRREIALVFIGDSFVAGVGDEKALGWTGRVMARTEVPGALVAHYNLGVRGETAGGVAERWQTEGARRFRGVSERRLVVQLGHADVQAGTSIARLRLNPANILDEASSRGVAVFVVGPPPAADADTNDALRRVVEAQRDVCDRRGVTFVDTFTPPAGHDQWESDIAASLDGVHPGRAGYGLIARLVLHHGWGEWMG
ncbi:GDSL-type esterase/lipase family protein [Janibacter limosus]|uniref:GDSL-type esterase/lipase family protein n=1 Tax=Janibacter limosus TaxID=53458 RepID=UPI0035DAF6E0|nr:GDSL-type esterase/lipase family protein [Janibacter limosus]